MESKVKIRETAGGVIVSNEGKMLLVKLPSGEWFFPKGGIENGETPLEAAEREIGEETGIERGDLQKLKDFLSYQRPQLDNKEIIQRIHMFLFTTQKIDAHTKPEFRDEISETKWVAKEEVVELLSAPEDREFFLRVLGEIQEALQETKSEIRKS